jgi:hypothetical protein
MQRRNSIPTGLPFPLNLFVARENVRCSLERSYIVPMILAPYKCGLGSMLESGSSGNRPVTTHSTDAASHSRSSEDGVRTDLHVAHDRSVVIAFLNA